MPRTLHLQIGEVIVSPEPVVISTVLGSCVSVCLFSSRRKAGGMIHFAHPRSDARTGDCRYGDAAMAVLLEQMMEVTGEDADDFAAKIVGGAGDLDGVSKDFDVGAENIRLAKSMLAHYGIPIVGEAVGGKQGRKVLFHTETGRLQVANLPIRASVFPVSPRSPGVPSSPKTMFPAPTVLRSPTSRRKVLIVDDSSTIRDLLKRVLGEDPDFEIVGMASDPVEAGVLLKRIKPDVITLDVHMPKMTGVQWLEKFLPLMPIPTVMFSSLDLQAGNEIFRALELGAVDYLQKPALHELAEIGPIIREKVKAASFAKVFPPAPKKMGPGIFDGEIDTRKVLAIGASTGGTEALKKVMCALPARIPPTLIVQHIPKEFSKTFADRLNELCPFEVKEAEDGDEVRPSRVLIAPGGKQMKLRRSNKGLTVVVTDDAPVNRHKPSVDYLFHSVAEVMGKNAVGVILTGMGEDGAAGLLSMRKSGARTVGQDEKSCVVYGMPKVAFEVGAVEVVCPLSEVPRKMMSFFSMAKKKTA